MRRQLELLQLRVDETVARWEKSLRRFSLLALLLDAGQAFSTDGMSFLSASLSYYALLALFPLLLLLIALASYFISETDALAAVLRVARDYLPGVETELQRVLRQVVDARGSATMIGLLTLLWSASGVFDVLQHALNRAWRVPEPRAFWLQRLVSIGVIAVLGLFFLASVIVSSFSETLVLALFGETVGAHQAIRWLGSIVGLAFAFIAFAILYKTFPNARVSWSVAWRGALVAAVLWQVAKFLYEFYLVYLARFNLVYGSVGAIIGLLLWGYISATIVLFCAELSAAMSRREQSA